MGMVGMRSVHERAVGLQARDLGESGWGAEGEK